MSLSRADVVVVGAGHNGLVAATFLARAGLRVVVVEAADIVGGAAKTEQPFAKVPGLSQSTGAYLLGLMPPELPRKLGVELPMLRRDPHYFLPTTGDRYLLFGSDREATRRQYRGFFSAADWLADEALQAELDQLRDDLAPAWLAEPLALRRPPSATSAPELRETFVDLCRGSVGDYLDRFGFTSDLVKAMYAVTDGLSGLDATWDTPGSGHNFLVHNMCRLPGSDGTWMVVRGGMGTVTSTHRRPRARRRRDDRHRQRRHEHRDRGRRGSRRRPRRRPTDRARRSWSPRPIRSGCASSSARRTLPTAINAKLDGWKHDGTTLKVNLALNDLPTFSCLPERRGQHGATIHLLPEDDVLELTAAHLRRGEGRQARRLPDHRVVHPHHRRSDPARPGGPPLLGAVRPVGAVRARRLDLGRRAGGLRRAAAVDLRPLRAGDLRPGRRHVRAAPPDIEAHFGITRGHIHHVDNAVAFADRMPYSVGISGLYAGGAGCHPAGSVIGAAGHNAAMRVLADLVARCLTAAA